MTLSHNGLGIHVYSCVAVCGSVWQCVAVCGIVLIHMVDSNVIHLDVWRHEWYFR